MTTSSVKVYGRCDVRQLERCLRKAGGHEQLVKAQDWMCRMCGSFSVPAGQLCDLLYRLRERKARDEDAWCEEFGEECEETCQICRDLLPSEDDPEKVCEYDDVLFSMDPKCPSCVRIVTRWRDGETAAEKPQAVVEAPVLPPSRVSSPAGARSGTELRGVLGVKPGFSLDQMREQLRGGPYALLIEHHLGQMDQEKRINAILGTREFLPAAVRPEAEGFIDRWNVRGCDVAFWTTDGGKVFDEILADARELVIRCGQEPDPGTLFHLFNLVTLNFAYTAEEEPESRAVMGIRKPLRFPVWSTLSVLAPVVHMLLRSTRPVPLTDLLGVGISQLGYILLGAGILGRGFGIFGLKTRPQLFVVGAIVLLVGIVLVNAKNLLTAMGW
jgi:hypothetical protein